MGLRGGVKIFVVLESECLHGVDILVIFIEQLEKMLIRKTARPRQLSWVAS